MATIRCTFNGDGANGRPGLGAMGISDGFVGGIVIDGNDDDDDDEDGRGFLRFRIGFLVVAIILVVDAKRLFVGGTDKSSDFECIS